PFAAGSDHQGKSPGLIYREFDGNSATFLKSPWEAAIQTWIFLSGRSSAERFHTTLRLFPPSFGVSRARNPSGGPRAEGAADAAPGKSKTRKIETRIT